MPDETQPPPLDRAVNPTQPEGEDPNAFLWFDGILEGPVGDRERMRACQIRLDAVGVLRSSLEIEGGRFSLLLDDRSRKMAGVRDSQRQSVMGFLQEIVDSSADKDRVESTLRCTEIAHGTANETLFAVVQGQVQRVSRSRTAIPDDLRRLPRPSSVMGEEFSSPKSKRAIVIGALVLAGIMVLWQSGIIDHLLAPAAETIVINEDEFDDLLDLKLTKSFGVYELTVSRSESYPTTTEEFVERMARTRDLKQSAVLGTAFRGEAAFVQMSDENGDLLFEKGVSLKKLLLAPDSEIKVLIPGRHGAANLHLSLTQDGPPR